MKTPLSLQKIIKTHIIQENSIGTSQKIMKTQGNSIGPIKNQKNYTDPPENQENSYNFITTLLVSKKSRKLYSPLRKSSKLK